MFSFERRPHHQRQVSQSSRENVDPNAASTAPLAALTKPATAPSLLLKETQSSINRRRNSITATAAVTATAKPASTATLTARQPAASKTQQRPIVAAARERREARQSVKRVRDEKADGSAVINVILASENVKLAESISWTKPKAAKKQKTDEEGAAEQQPTETSSRSVSATTAATAPTLTVTVTNEHAMDVTPLTSTAAANAITDAATPPTPLSKPAPAADIVKRTRAALERWVASCPAQATGSFAHSTPSRLRRTASPGYIDALHVLGPLLAQQQYGAALTQLNTVATLFPCHRTQAEYYVLRAFAVEKLQQSDEEVCGVYRAAIECGAQPACGVLEGFQSFERRRNERLGQHTSGGSSTSVTSAGVNAPATPMSRLLHKYKSARPSLTATPAATSMAAGVPPATPRSALLRSRLFDNEQEDSAPTTTATTPRSAQLRKLKLTPEFSHTPPPAPATTQQRQSPQREQDEPFIESPQIDTPRTQAGETVVAAEQTTPQLARNLLDDMQAADEMTTPPMPRTPADALSPLTPLLLSVSSPATVKEVAQTGAEEVRMVKVDSKEDDADTSMASPEAPAGLFDEDEYIPGLSTPFPSIAYTQPSVTVATRPASRPILSISAAQAAVPPAQSPSSVVMLASVRASPSVSRALGSEYFVSPVRRSTRHMSAAAASQTEAQLSNVEKHKLLENPQYAYLPNNALQPPRAHGRVQGAATSRADTAHNEQQSDDLHTAAPVLAITIEAAQATTDEEESEPIIKAVPRRGTPMHARRPHSDALLPPPPIAQPNLIVLQPIRSPHTAATSSLSSSSSSAASFGSSLSSAPFVSPVRRSARHSVDWTDAAHQTVVQLEAGKVSLKPNASLGDREQEWKLQAERDRAAMPPPPPRMPRGGKRAATTATAQHIQQHVEVEVVVVPAPAGRFEGGKRHATPRPSGTRRSSRLVARDDDTEAPTSDEAAELERAAHARITRRRSQRFD